MIVNSPSDPELIRKMKQDEEVSRLSRELFNKICEYKYAYNFSWLGRPIIQFPQDIVAMQEIIWNVRPQIIVETGIAHGGSIIFSASMLSMLGEGGEVVGVDIDIREHNRKEIEAHPLFPHIHLIEGSSVDAATVDRVKQRCAGKERILVILDSNHTHEHVLSELNLYSPLVRKDSYIIVFDTVIEDMPTGIFPDRPWDIGDNPKTAVHEFLKTNKRFEIDREVEDKLLFSVAPDGYLRCTGS